jgi:hypothetical protein
MVAPRQAAFHPAPGVPSGDCLAVWVCLAAALRGASCSKSSSILPVATFAALIAAPTTSLAAARLWALRHLLFHLSVFRLDATMPHARGFFRLD